MGFTEPLGVWDKFQVFQGRRSNTPYIRIGTRGGKSSHLKLEKHSNAIKQALYFKSLIDTGQADSQSELARLTDTPRTTITAYLRLLRLFEDVRTEALNIPDDDGRVAALTLARLRRLLDLTDPTEQRSAFHDVLTSAPATEPGRRSK